MIDKSSHASHASHAVGANDQNDQNDQNGLNRASRRQVAARIDKASPQAAAEREVVTVTEVIPQLVRVTTRTGETLDLWDDIPTHRLLYGMRLLAISARQEAAAEAGDSEAFLQAADERDQETRAVCALIVRHSYPQLAAAEVASLLAPDVQEALIAHFFTRRLVPYFAQQHALKALLPDTGVSAASPAAAAEAAADR